MADKNPMLRILSIERLEWENSINNLDQNGHIILPDNQWQQLKINHLNLIENLLKNFKQ